MEQYIKKSALLAEIEKLEELYCYGKSDGILIAKSVFDSIKNIINTLEVKEVDNVWHEVDNINMPQPDKNKIYCVFTKDRYVLAKVISHPNDEELLQWKCTEFPHHRYDMCEGDKYMQII